MTTSTDIVNEAIQLIGDNQALVTGVAPTFDSSTAGKAAQYLYVPTVQAVGRRFGWDFSRNIVTLQPSGNAPPWPWAIEYLYPTNGIQIRQLSPPSLTDPNDPLPVNWEIGNTTVNSAIAKVIWTNLANAIARISNTPPEGVWDPLYRDAVVRLLSSALAMAVAGKPDTARDMIDSYNAVEQLGETRLD
jgi:hypothetical protein